MRGQTLQSNAHLRCGEHTSFNATLQNTKNKKEILLKEPMNRIHWLISFNKQWLLVFFFLFFFLSKPVFLELARKVE